MVSSRAVFAQKRSAFIRADGRSTKVGVSAAGQGTFVPGLGSQVRTERSFAKPAAAPVVSLVVSCPTAIKFTPDRSRSDGEKEEDRLVSARPALEPQCELKSPSDQGTCNDPSKDLV